MPEPSFVGATQLLEEVEHDRVFGMRRKVLGVDQTVAHGSIGVFGYHALRFNNQLGGIGTGVLTVNQQVGNHLAEDFVAQADALVAFQIEGVGQVLLYELTQPLVGFYQN